MKQANDLKEDASLDTILLPSAMFRANEEVLLDDVTLSDLEKHFGKNVKKIESEGKALLSHLIYGGTHV